MRFSKFIIPTIAIFFLNGCEFFDEMFNFDSQQERIINNIQFQKESDPKSVIVTSKCKYNKRASYIYYKTPSDIDYHNYYKKIDSLSSTPTKEKPFWDIRYVNKIYNYTNSNQLDELSKKISFSLPNNSNSTLFGTNYLLNSKDANLVTTKCEDGVITSKATLNLLDTPNQYIEYGGPQSSFKYIIKNSNLSKPWSSDKTGNLMIQASFNKPEYKRYEQNMGGTISFGFIIHNKKLNKYISYVIGVYAAGDAWLEERAKLHYDTSTGFIHVATTIDNGTWWSTKSPKSELSVRVKGTPEEIKNDRDFRHFFRVNITYNNIKAILRELKNNPPIEASGEDFGLNPEDWQVTSIFIQFELEEEGGNAILSTSFKGFEAYKSKLPL